MGTTKQETFDAAANPPQFTGGEWWTSGKANCLGTFTVFHSYRTPTVANQICMAPTLADATLISASKELLIALQGLLADDVAKARAIIDEGPGGTSSEDDARQLILKRENAARSALAKATGEQT
jgi:hypothetical protein